MEDVNIVVLDNPNMFSIPLEDDEDNCIEFFEYKGIVEIGIANDDEGHGIAMDMEKVIQLRDWLNSVIETAE